MDNQYLTRGVYSDTGYAKGVNTQKNTVQAQRNIHAYRATGIDFSSVMQSKNSVSETVNNEMKSDTKDIKLNKNNGVSLLAELSQLVNIPNKFVTNALIANV